MDKLFLLRPNFNDSKMDDEGKLYYCPQCAFIEGVIKYYPQLEKRLEINYTDFKKPREIIFNLIGEENQSCPVLIIDNNHEDLAISYVKSNRDKLFINSADLIAKYLAERYEIGLPHP